MLVIQFWFLLPFLIDCLPCYILFLIFKIKFFQNLQLYLSQWVILLYWSSLNLTTCHFYHLGRVKYMFASFWNRNHTLRALERAVKNFHATIEAEKEVLAIFCGFSANTTFVHADQDNLRFHLLVFVRVC